jgi:hypothetical protein
MHKPLLLVLACALWACSDASTQPRTDAGDKSDASDQSPDAGKEAGAPSALGERPPGSLDRPPGTKLPDDLRPPKQ